MTIQDAINFDRSGLTRVEAQPTQARFVSEETMPKYNPMQRTPLPPNGSTVDSQRNFYQVSKIPQFRIATPATNAPTGNVNVTNNVTASGGSAITTVVANTDNSNPDQTIGFTTPSIDAGFQFQGSLAMAKSFIAKRVTVNNPARIRLYSTALFQLIDATRGETINTLNGTEHGVILDVWLDQTLNWVLSPAALGGNCDDPDSNVIYITVDNIGASSNPITVSIDFVGEET